MESCVSQFNAWPVILFTTLQQAGAKAAGKLAIHPESGSYLTLRKELFEEMHVADKASDCIGKGTPVGRAPG